MKLLLFVYLFYHAMFDFTKARVRLVPKIVGGRNAEPDEFPFVVSIQQPINVHSCGGIIFSLGVVVSSCHCAGIFSNKHFVKFNPRQMVAVGGSINRTASESNQVRKVIQVIRHSLCKELKNSWLYDYSFLVLEREFSHSPGKIVISPVYSYDLDKLRKFEDDLIHGPLCEGVGWGNQNVAKTGVYVNRTQILKVAKLKVISKTKCEHDLCHGPQNDVCLGDLKQRKVICAVGVKGDTCTGDSGGPIICSGYVVGITSWGPECGELGVYPTLYSSMEGLLKFSFSFPYNIACEILPHAKHIILIVALFSLNFI